MSRATSGGAPKRGYTQTERRDAESPRVQFEALVEVGSGEVGGFEAESVDVSPDGIRLRTAYLPNLGDRLVCRFDGFGGEIVAEGEVIWRTEEGRGGEFGLKFIGLDEHGSALLREMCAVEPEPQPDAADARTSAYVGSRVKLHIEGLGSPMRARVKDTSRGEVLVGSSLEFLRVGRDIEIEDVEQGGRRTAMIEHVGVEIDSESNIPQLVVALKFDARRKSTVSSVDASEGQAPRDTRPSDVRGAELHARDSKETTPEPTVIDREAPPRRMPPPRRPVVEAHASEDLPEVDAMPDDEPSTLATTTHREPQTAAAEKAEQVGKALGGIAKAIGPTLSRAGSSARGALGTVVESIRKRREAREALMGAKGVKRTTAPPPGGALRSDGRRLFRQAGEAAEEGIATGRDSMSKRSRKTAVAVSVTAALTVIGVYVFASQLGKGRTTDAQASAATTALVAADAVSGESGGPVPGGGVATTDVPLFGATPLSTTEPVPVPPNAEELGLDIQVPAPAAADGGPESGDQGDGEGNATEGSVGNGGMRKAWEVGEVKDPVSLKLTMDGDVSGFTGTEGATGFTLVIPGRKSVSSASGLARKDKRIDSLNVVNYPDRAEVTLRFKGDVPPFAVKTSRNRVTIDLDGGKPKKDASATSTAKSSKKKKDAKKASHDRDKSAGKSKKKDSAKAKRESAKTSSKKDSKKSKKK